MDVPSHRGDAQPKQTARAGKKLSWLAVAGLLSLVALVVLVIAAGWQWWRLALLETPPQADRQTPLDRGETPVPPSASDLPALPDLPKEIAAGEASQPAGVSQEKTPPADSGPKTSSREKAEAATTGSLAEVQAEPPATPQAAAEEMQQVVSRLLEDFPNHSEALDLMARVHLLFGRSSEAAKCWEQAIQANPNDTRAYRGLASVAQIKNEPQEQLRLLRKALAIDVRSFDVQFDLAKALVDQGQIKEAIKLLEAHVVLYPNSPRSFSLLGAAYLQDNAFQEAKQAYLAAVKLEPGDDFPYLGLAKACARLGQHEESQGFQKKFEELRSKHRQKIRSHRGRYEDLAAQCDTLSNICTHVGRIYHGQGRLLEAERHWRRAAFVTPTHVDSRKALADLYSRHAKKKELISVLEQLVRIVPADASYGLQLARLYLEENQWDKAQAVLEEACRRDAQSAESRALLAELHLKADRKIDQAVALARQATELSPTAEHYWLLARACQRHGDVQAAVKALEKAVELDPGNLQYHEILHEFKK